MTEKETIEEMCKNFKCCVSCEMFNGYVDSNGELKNCSCAEHSDSHCTQCYISTSQAKVLYNEGYRNCKDKVVLSKEEYEELKHFKAKMSLPYRNISKETAKEILKFVKEKSWCYQVDKNGEAWTYSITVAQLKELAKKYGVEVEVEK